MAEPSTVFEPELVERALRQDPEAVEALMEQVYRAVFGYCYHFWQDRDRAEDSAQEIVVRVYRHLPKYRRSGSFPAWVFRIAFNYVRQRYRYEKLRRWLPLHRETEATVSNPGDPEQAALVRERLGWLARGLLTLHEKERTALILRGAHQLSYEEIARAMNCSLAQVKNYLFRGRKRLQQRWAQQAEGLPLTEGSHA